jgi:putative ABC transport system permease protein
VTGVISRRTRLRPADALGEAATAIAARPLGAVAVSVGTLAVLAWFVAVVGLVSTASGQVTSAFVQRLPTTITITAPVSALPYPPFPYPSDVEQRLDSLPGVSAAGVWWLVKTGRPVIVSAQRTTAGPIIPPHQLAPPVIAATPGFLVAAGVQVSQGRAFDDWDQAHAAPVCLVGAALARTLRLAELAAQPVIYLNDMACQVSGVISGAVRTAGITTSVVLPAATAAVLFGPPDEPAGARPRVLIWTRPGAAGQVARLAPYAISQARPARFTAHRQAGPVLLRHQVSAALNGVFAAIGWVGLGIGALVIAGLAALRTAHRLPEYSLRRALGARRRHVVAHVLAESVLLGLIGSIAGASLGIAIVVLTARARHWTPVVAPLTLWPAPLAGVAAAAIGGIGPALRAAFVSPWRGLARLTPL